MIPVASFLSHRNSRNHRAYCASVLSCELWRYMHIQEDQYLKERSCPVSDPVAALLSTATDMLPCKNYLVN